MKRKVDIGTLLSKKLEGAKQTPDSGLWDRISASLDANQKRKRRFLFFWLLGTGAIVTLTLLLIGPFKSEIPSAPDFETNTSEIVNGDSVKPLDSSDSRETDIPENAIDTNSTKTNSILNEDGDFNTENQTTTVTSTSPEANTLVRMDSEKNGTKTINSEPVVSNKNPKVRLTSNNKSEKPISENTAENISGTTKTIGSDTDRKSKFEADELKSDQRPVKKKITASDATSGTSSTPLFSPTAAKDTLVDKSTKLPKSILQDSDNSGTSESEKLLAIRAGLLEERAALRDSIKQVQQQKRDSILEVRKIQRDSLGLPPIEKDSLTPEEDFRMKMGISAIGAPVYFGVGKNGSAIDNVFVGFDKTGSTTFSYGFEVYWRILERFRLSYGFMLTNFNNTTNEVPSATTAERQRILNFSGTEVGILNNFLGTDTDVSIYQEIRYLDMPLHLTYEFGHNALGIQAYAGTTFFAHMNNEVFVEKNDGRRLSLGEADTLSKVNISLDIGIGLYYKFSEILSLDIKPTYKYHINTIRALNFDGKTYSIGIYTGLRYQFR